jgi:hypothetical protein
MYSRELSTNRKSVSEHSQTLFEFKRKRITSVETADTKFFSKLKELFKKIASPRETNRSETSPDENLTDDEKIAIETHELYSLNFEEEENVLEPLHIPEINLTKETKDGKKTSDKLKIITDELGIRRCASQEVFGELTPRMENTETLAYKETLRKLNADKNYHVDEFSFQETETIYSKETNGEGNSSSFLHSLGTSSGDYSFTEDHPEILQYLTPNQCK